MVGGGPALEHVECGFVGDADGARHFVFGFGCWFGVFGFGCWLLVAG